MVKLSAVEMSLSSILNVFVLVTLALALGLSGAALGLFAHNNILGFCVLALDDNSQIGNQKLCKASLAGYIIASICIAVVTMMEFNGLVYGRTTNIAGKILQIILLLVSIVFLLISGISVAVGWAKTCKTIKNDNDRVPSCSDNENSLVNQEMVGSAVCAFLGLIFTVPATIVAVKNILTRKEDDEKKPIIDKY